MGNRNKASGTGFERSVVTKALKRGLLAHRQPGSGAFKGIPNDLVVEGWLGEAKTYTTHPSMTQMMEWFDGVAANAKRYNYRGAFLVYNHKGSRRPVVVLALADFLALLERGLDKSAKM